MASTAGNRRIITWIDGTEVGHFSRSATIHE